MKGGENSHMKANRLTQAIAMVCVLGVFGMATVCEAQDSDVPELKVLRHYVGEWDVKISEHEELNAVVKAKWILDGRFVQQTSTIKDASGDVVMVLTTLMTYDTGKKTYRSWSFTSAGTTSEGVASWDEESKTMTTRGEEDDGGSTTITATFAKDGEEHWSIATENVSGGAASVITGVNARREKK